MTVHGNQPRRPAQIDPEQVEMLTGEPDPAVTSELAHTSAQALVEVGERHVIDDPAVKQRILDLIETEGIDVVAESWVRSPADTLPGILWRGYLLREWIRREPDNVAARFAASRAVEKAEAENAEPATTHLSPQAVRDEWGRVFEGDYEGDFVKLLAASATLTQFIGAVEPVWIDTDDHVLATRVPRRERALLDTASEFHAAIARFMEGSLD